MKKIIVLFFCILSLICLGQNSTDYVSQTYKNDSVIIEEYIEIANNIFFQNVDSAEVLIRKAKALAIRSNYKPGLSKVDGFLGNIYQSRSNFIEAINYYKSSIKYNTVNNFELQKAMDLGNYGDILTILKDPKAEDFVREAISIYERYDKKEDLVFLYSNLANYYNSREDIDSALRYYRKAYLSSDNLYQTAAINVGLSEVYINLNLCDSAHYHVQKYLEIGKTQNDSSIISHAYRNLLDIKFKTGDLDSALYFGLKVGSLTPHLSRFSKGKFYKRMGQIYGKRGAYKLAFEMFDSSLLYLDRTYNSDLQKLAFKEAVKLELHEGKISDSLQYVSDKQNIEIQYDSQLQTESQKRIRLIIGFIAILIFAALLFIGYRKTSARNKIILAQKVALEKRNEERAILIREVHHRVKNNFQIICSVLRLQSGYLNNKQITTVFEDAINRITSMAKVHDMFYKNEVFVDPDPKVYFENLILGYPQSFHGKEVTYQVICKLSTLDLDTLISLGIITNELITNSLKHAFTSADSPPKISISVSQIGNEVQFSFKDNGVGFHNEQLELSFGMELIKTMTEQLDGQSNMESNDGVSFSLSFVPPIYNGEIFK